MRFLLTFVALSTFFSVSIPACACNIPVFRFALERWTPDAMEVIVLHDAPFSESEQRVLSELDSASEHSNIKVILRDVSHGTLEGSLKKLDIESAELKSFTGPTAVIRSRAGRGKSITIWTGPVKELAVSEMITSPVRNELSKRLLSGDSIVWLVLKSADDKKSAQVVTQLRDSLPQIARQIPFPEGIGLPGSELYAAIPLDMRFTVLEVDPNDPKEAFLKEWLTKFHPDDYAAGDPLIVPVFGRGRALEVIPARALNPSLIDQLCVFLCGACSCQVKDLNPGFDLLISTDWHSELFGEEAPEFLDDGLQRAAPDSEPEFIEIPPGLPQDR
ncbi:hypothetical protein KOR42_33330 [Thalassoglobus neptunius]|uniref:Uncharacterized protein n=1 Tax=Thalassoglobus neptunius TaxID=1938619 RepID=A0A5C5WP02_9PLAN|nr:hypothetical protein [Thalassoglobus neptunius]TWT51859.1 hypothetical protein KOR42_33330 [Thalassoglobus neptunius]